MNVRRFVTTSAWVTCLSVASGVNADEPRAQRQQTQAQPQVQVQVQPGAGQTGQRARWMNNDQVLASCIAIANQTEVTIAKLAQEKAKNKDVKEFANTMVKDHQQFLQKLQRFAPEAARDGYLNDRVDVGDDGNRQSNAKPRVAPAGAEVRNANEQLQQTLGSRPEANQPLDFVQLHREVAEECVRSAKEKMDKKNDAEFDECYIGFQIAAHAMMKDKLVVFQRHTSGELNQTIAEGLETTEKHLKKAEEIMKTLKNSEDRKSASRD